MNWTFNRLLVLLIFGVAACTDAASSGLTAPATQTADVSATGGLSEVVDSQGLDAADAAAPTPDVAVPADSADASAPVDTGPSVCQPNIAGCLGADRYVCTADGSAFEKSPCPGKLFCSDGTCVGCLGDTDCSAGQHCQAGSCTSSPLQVVTAKLPTGLVAQPYQTTLEASGGQPPLQWSVSLGALPPGLTLSPAGTITGVPTQAGVSPLTIQVKDSQGVTASAALSLEVMAAGLVITTASLKPIVEGQAMAPVTFAAQGGVAPYFFGIVSGKLPAGVTLTGDGVLSGTPSEDGDFTFDVKVFDNGDPTLSAKKTFTLTVGLAPLDIAGSQVINLIITKIIVLPLIIVVDKVPVPYNAQLQAIGGKKPYHWTEQPLPGIVNSLIPKSGLPKGLTLAEDGTLSGSVTDASLVVTVQVPLTAITLKGFFFSGQVTDSQSKVQSKTALFIIPTVPVGGP